MEIKKEKVDAEEDRDDYESNLRRQEVDSESCLGTQRNPAESNGGEGFRGSPTKVLMQSAPHLPPLAMFDFDQRGDAQENEPLPYTHTQLESLDML